VTPKTFLVFLVGYDAVWLPLVLVLPENPRL
jgi:hypothetical protein